jgi:hypothetical protein
MQSYLEKMASAVADPGMFIPLIQHIRKFTANKRHNRVRYNPPKGSSRHVVTIATTELQEEKREEAMFHKQDIVPVTGSGYRIHDKAAPLIIDTLLKVIEYYSNSPLLLEGLLAILKHIVNQNGRIFVCQLTHC